MALVGSFLRMADKIDMLQWSKVPSNNDKMHKNDNEKYHPKFIFNQNFMSTF